MKRSAPLARKTPLRRTRPKAKASPRKRAMPSRGPWRSEAYLRFVRSKPCCVCSAPPPSEAHHWGGKGSHGMGQKCSDALVSPVCYQCHAYWHTCGAFSWRKPFKDLRSRAWSEAVQIKAQRDSLAEWVAMKEAV